VLGLNEGLPEKEETDTDQPAHQADSGLAAGQQGQVQYDQQADQHPALALAQYGRKTPERVHGWLCEIERSPTSGANNCRSVDTNVDKSTVFSANVAQTAQ